MKVILGFALLRQNKNRQMWKVDNFEDENLKQN